MASYYKQGVVTKDYDAKKEAKEAAVEKLAAVNSDDDKAAEAADAKAKAAAEKAAKAKAAKAAKAAAKKA